MIDDDRFPALVDFVADRCFDFQLPSRLEAELNLVLHRAADPTIVGDAGDGGKAHARDPANDVQDRRNRRDAIDRPDIRLKIVRHGPTQLLPSGDIATVPAFFHRIKVHASRPTRAKKRPRRCRRGEDFASKLGNYSR
jgi:hypothetical protein